MPGQRESGSCRIRSNPTATTETNHEEQDGYIDFVLYSFHDKVAVLLKATTPNETAYACLHDLGRKLLPLDYRISQIVIAVTSDIDGFEVGATPERTMDDLLKDEPRKVWVRATKVHYTFSRQA
jgi:hypothetical protein